MALSKIDVANMVTGATPVTNGGTGQTTLAAAGLQRPDAKPLIINGDMVVAQRGTSTASITGGALYTVDRFETANSGAFIGTWTQTQESLSSGDAFTDGFAKSLKMDCTTSNDLSTANSQCRLDYKFEGLDLQLLKHGTASAEKTTLSFWIKATKTGTNIVKMYKPDADRSCSIAYTVSSSNTWEKKVLNFPADTTGTVIANDNTTGIQMSFGIAMGSSYTSGTLATTWAADSSANAFVGQVNNADSTSNNWEITGVQLEVGEYSSTTLPPFQHESFGDNFARCARYFFRVAQHGADGLSNQTVGTGYYKNTDQFRVSVYLPVKPRTNPSLVSGSASNAYVIDIQGSTDYVDDFTLTRSNAKNIQVMHNSSDASGTIGEAGEIATDNSSGIIDFNAEL